MVGLSRAILLTKFYFIDSLSRRWRENIIILQPPTAPRYARAEFSIFEFSIFNKCFNAQIFKLNSLKIKKLKID
ncbi:TPA: hypothetical protein DCL87_02355 [Candidatus Azambacteria bacterium]|nr:hypothetical protein [Candidatus Azambacteria bacterium]